MKSPYIFLSKSLLPILLLSWAKAETSSLPLETNKEAKVQEISSKDPAPHGASEVNMKNHPFLDTSFQIPWSQLTPDHIKADVNLALAQAKQNITKISQLKEDQLSYESSFLALEEATDALNRSWGRTMHLDSVSDNEPQRAVIAEMMPEVVSFSSSIMLNSQLWDVLKKAHAKLAATPDFGGLTPIQKRFVLETMRDFEENGANLPDDKKKRVSEINNELSQLTKNYRENVLDSTNEWDLVITDKTELKGLPDSALNAAHDAAKAKGLGSDEEPVWRFTLQPPSMSPVLQFAENDNLRKQIWTAFTQVGSGKFENENLVPQILQLREEKAQLLGFKNFADAMTGRRMAGSGKKAITFIEDLHKLVRPAYLKDIKTLIDYKAKTTGHPVENLEPWEISYWSEKQRQALYNFDEEELRPYFSVDNVMKGLFEISSTLFGITVVEKPTTNGPAGIEGNAKVEVWHPEVRFYEVHDKKTGEHLGSFYADWHPRESKRGGAWMNQLEVGMPPQGNDPRKPHLGLICGNMTKPIGDKPALLTHYEVETIFHEFGHLLHLMLADVPVKTLAGTNVAWDFVELPSQIMENWCWQRDSVNSFARHIESNEPIPQALFDKMIAARNYQSAMVFMRQLSFAKADLELHINLDQYKGRPIAEVEDEILKEYSYEFASKAPGMSKRFNHIFGASEGYAAGYYSYKWAEVLEADAFTRFKKEGILNPTTGLSFRSEILSKGNSHPAAELYRNFMGRDPELKALLVRSGILPNEE